VGVVSLSSVRARRRGTADQSREVDPRDYAIRQRRVISDARVDHGDADAGARETRLRKESEE
jgi:hypothetical protein